MVTTASGRHQRPINPGNPALTRMEVRAEPQPLAVDHVGAQVPELGADGDGLRNVRRRKQQHNEMAAGQQATLHHAANLVLA